MRDVAKEKSTIAKEKKKGSRIEKYQDRFVYTPVMNCAHNPIQKKKNLWKIFGKIELVQGWMSDAFIVMT